MALTCGVDNSFTFGSDPNNSTSINAVAIHGAIQVTWNYPAVNPHAVAHVNLLRSTNNVSGSQLAVVKGSYYRDQMTQADAGITYYYWIQIVSVNGTELDLVGPASATAGNLSASTSALLDGMIDSSLLAAALRTQIELIPTLRTDLIDETTGRLQALSDVDDILNSLGLDVTTAFAEIITERDTRIDGLNALATQVSAIAASNGTNLAAIISEQTARVTADSAEATARDTLAVRVTDSEAAIVSESTARADADGALASQIDQIVAGTFKVFRQPTAPTSGEGRIDGSIWFDTDDGNSMWQWDEATTQWITLQDGAIIDAFAAIQTEQTARTSADSAFAADLTTVESSVTVLEDGIPNLIQASIIDNNTTAIGYCMIGGQPSTSASHDTKSECESAGGTWLAMREISDAVKGVQISDDGGATSASIEQRAVVYRNELDQLNSQYTVKLQQHVNGNWIVGGFGLSIDGGTGIVDAGFDVDTFWIGRLGDAAGNGQGRYPFKVVGNDVYMQNAFIENLTVDTIKLTGGSVSTTDYEAFGNAHVVLFPLSSSTFPEWRHRAGSQTDSAVVAVIDGTNYTAGANLPEGALWVGGVAGESYEALIIVNFELGIKSRTNGSQYLLNFAPVLEIKRGGYSDLTRVLQSVLVQGNLCDANPIAMNYSAQSTVTVNADSLLTYNLKDTMTLSNNTAFGTSYSPVGGVCHYAFIRRISYMVHVYKR